jgi:hypothetical protein
VLTDCVRNVARAADYSREHLAKLLAGNCLKLYGRRLQAAVERRPDDAAGAAASATTTG